MLATTLNVEFDPERSWDEKKEIYRISNKIVRTANVTQSAVGDKRGLWTTVIASAIFLLDQGSLRWPPPSTSLSAGSAGCPYVVSRTSYPLLLPSHLRRSPAL